ncbi:hypothetical protein [Sphingobacterium sp. BS-2]|uniref:hypothetical protein n=1 Tax=Sphingobacterium sp. BS-2 TaxID=3377129 RepID=UPI0038FBEB2F
MLSKDHPIKRDDLLKDIPDNKAFYPCAMGCAKSHLKWAEALRIRVVFGIRELLRRFVYFCAPKVTEKYWHLDVHLDGYRSRDAARCSSKVQWMFISTVIHRSRDAARCSFEK